jgi:UDPglucose 6-dehydrogenase
LPEKIVERLFPLIQRGAKVAILGLAYKPYSHVIEESVGIYLAKTLSGTGARVIGYDPLASEAARNVLAYHALVLDSLLECLEQADVVLITTPDPLFKKITADDPNKAANIVTVVDFWRILDNKLNNQSNNQYIPVGRSIENVSNAARLDQLWSRSVEA